MVVDTALTITQQARPRNNERATANPFSLDGRGILLGPGGLVQSPASTPRTRGDRPHVAIPGAHFLTVPPLRYSKRIDFECTIPLPSRPAKQATAPKRKNTVKKPTKAKKPRRTPTPLELQERIQKRSEYEKTRSQRPERKQHNHDNIKKRRQRAKELGICSACSQPANTGQTRCPTCAEKHRTRNRQDSEKRRRAKGMKPRPRINAELIEQIRKEIAAQDTRGASTTPKGVDSEHYKKNRQQHQAQVRAERKSLGLRVRCAKPSLEGQTRCADCVLKHRQSGLRGRVKAKLTAEQ